MTAIFRVRLPMEALTRETAKATAVPYLLDIKATKTHWIITWRLEESENYDRFGMEDGRGWMAPEAPRGARQVACRSLNVHRRQRPGGGQEVARVVRPRLSRVT